MGRNRPKAPRRRRTSRGLARADGLLEGADNETDQSKSAHDGDRGEAHAPEPKLARLNARPSKYFATGPHILRTSWRVWPSSGTDNLSDRSLIDARSPAHPEREPRNRRRRPTCRKHPSP